MTRKLKIQKIYFSGFRFIEFFVTQFCTIWERSSEVELDLEMFECKGIMCLFSHLYNFDIIPTKFILEIINFILSGIHVLGIDLLYLIFRNCGIKLRSEEPVEFKELIIRIKMAHSELEARGEGSVRVSVLLDQIYDLKNGKYAEKGIHDSLNTARKNMNQMIVKEFGHSRSLFPLGITFEDIRNIPEKGRWWIVGSSHSNSRNLNKRNAEHDGDENDIKRKRVTGDSDEKLLELAKLHRMNTPTRTSIFCVIMGSNDFTEAFEKLTKLNLKQKQDREVVSVLLHCALEEKLYNPYYSHLSSQLITFNSEYRITFQYALWDKGKEIEGLKLQQLNNLAHLIVFLISKESMPLSVLRGLDFFDTRPKAILFFRLILKNWCSQSSIEQIGAAGTKLIKVKFQTNSVEGSKYSTFIQGFKHFLYQEQLKALSHSDDLLAVNYQAKLKSLSKIVEEYQKNIF
jgi:nucleolar MIF4G domain-containing protein 1